jgi:hypothetical protein
MLARIVSHYPRRFIATIQHNQSNPSLTKPFLNPTVPNANTIQPTNQPKPTHQSSTLQTPILKLKLQNTNTPKHTPKQTHTLAQARALCAAPLLASLGSSHFLLASERLLLADVRGANEEVQEQMLRDTVCALIAAVYLGAAMGGGTLELGVLMGSLGVDGWGLSWC